MSLAGAMVAASGSVAAPDVSITHLLLQMVVAMVLVVGGIWGFGKLMGRSRAAGRNAGRAAGGLFRSRAGGRARDDGLTILSRQPVGKGKYLAVVQVGVQQFLVGIADSGLTPLGELHRDGPEPVPEDEPLPIAAHRRAPAASGAFDAAELAALDLQTLGVGLLDLGPPTVRVGGSRPVAVRPAPAAPRRTAPSREQPVHPARSLVESLREATVRR